MKKKENKAEGVKRILKSKLPELSNNTIDKIINNKDKFELPELSSILDNVINNINKTNVLLSLENQVNTNLDTNAATETLNKQTSNLLLSGNKNSKIIKGSFDFLENEEYYNKLFDIVILDEKNKTVFRSFKSKVISLNKKGKLKVKTFIGNKYSLYKDTPDMSLKQKQYYSKVCLLNKRAYIDCILELDASKIDNKKIILKF